MTATDTDRPIGITFGSTASERELSTMSTIATYAVSGMTCAHCVAAVSEEVGALGGVTAVDVDLNAGGDSRVTVTSTGPLPIDSVREAIDEAGYTLNTQTGSAPTA